MIFCLQLVTNAVRILSWLWKMMHLLIRDKEQAVMKFRLIRSMITMYGSAMMDNMLFGITTTLISGLSAALLEVEEESLGHLNLNVPMR